MIFLVIIFALVFAVIAYKKIDLAALILVACLPLYIVRFSIFNLPSTLLEVFSLILFIVWFLKNYKNIFSRLQHNLSVKKIFHRYPFDWEIILWLIIALVAVLTAGFSFKSLGIWRAYFFEPALLFIVFVNLFSSKEKIFKLAYPLSISALVIFLISAFQYATGLLIPNDFWAQDLSRRATSLFPYPNAVGLYLAPIIFFLAGTLPNFYKTNKKVFGFVIVSILASFLAILFARSEGAILAVIFVGLLGMLIANQNTRWIALMIMSLGFLAMSLFPPLKNYTADRLTLNNFSGQVRRIQWRETINMLYHGKILFGAGLANYQSSILPWHKDGFFFNKEKFSQAEFVEHINNDLVFRKSHWQPLEIYLYPHNIILNFWTELGLFGVLLFIWLIIKYFYLAIKSLLLFKKQNDNFSWVVLGLILAMLAILIHGLVDVPYFKNDLAIQFWLWFSLVGVSGLLIKTNPRFR